MTITSREHAEAVQQLLDYYLVGESVGCGVSHDQAQRAWERLADAAREHIADGWRPIEVGRRWRTRGQSAPDPETSWEDCPTCHDLGEVCRFHDGVRYGADEALRQAAQTLTAFARDPDQMLGVIDADQRQQELLAQQQQERQQRRTRVEADCPRCGQPRRWFDPAWAHYGCEKCDYQSQFATR
ncbi:hypothetical protein [Bounagaea algeriensis]